MSDHLSGEAFESLEEAERALDMPPSTYVIGEDDRQMILLALGHLAKERPGWDYALGKIADIFDGRELFEKSKQ